MKKYCMVLLMLVLCLLPSCGGQHKVLKGYSASSEHFETGGFRDYTDYCEYYYDETATGKFKNSAYYNAVTEDGIVQLNAFFTDYYKWIVLKDGYENWFSFKSAQMRTEDYFSLEIIDPMAPYGQFHNYNIYYYDTDKCTLYYFHNSC